MIVFINFPLYISFISFSLCGVGVLHNPTGILLRLGLDLVEPRWRLSKGWLGHCQVDLVETFS
jgi:hypothetical protein